MMGIVVPETCWAYKKYKWHLVGFSFYSYHNEAQSNKHQMCKEFVTGRGLLLRYGGGGGRTMSLTCFLNTEM